MKNVIMIDDDTEILSVFKLVFERAGYNITIFNSSDAVLANEFEEPDIFIIDRQINGTDGLDVCRYLKNRQPAKDTPVLIFSAGTRVNSYAYEAGADDFIEKPFKTKELIARVEKLTTKTSDIQ